MSGRAKNCVPQVGAPRRQVFVAGVTETWECSHLFNKYIGYMEDLILALLSGVLELLLEVLFEVVAGTFTDVAVRSTRKAIKKSKPISPIFAVALYVSLGVACGVASVLLFPHPLVHPSRIHGISLILSPLLTGLIMSQIGLVRRRKGKDTIRIESFGYGFTFALGVALIRFLFV